jgi:TonB family protein
MRPIFIIVLLLFISSTLLAQSDTAKSSQPSAGSAGPTAASQPPASPPPTMPGDSSHLVIKTYKRADYPAEARNQQMQGRVWVHLIIDEAGDVVSIDPVSGEGSLLAAAMAAMKQWKFEPYIQNGHAVRVSSKMYYDFAFTDKIRDKQAPSTPIALAPGVSKGLLIHQVYPVYPSEAERKRIQGTVVLKAVIGKDGIIRDIQVVNSPSDDLSRAAKEAVAQWRYRPYSLAGELVEIDTTINVNFRLR